MALKGTRMLRKHVFLHLIRGLGLILVLNSCVGTIEERPSLKPSVEGQKAKVNFAGAVKCEAVSQDKIDIYFNKGSVDGSIDQNNIVYQIFQDGNYDEAVATSIGSQIPEDENGMLHMMVGGIPKNTEASFVVRAFDSISGDSDQNYVTCIEKTLNEDLPDFNGIGEVSKINGLEGRSNLLLSWAPAKGAVTIGEIEVRGYDIAGYNIYFGKSPSEMELFTTVPVTKSNHPREYKFNGLSPGIKYYFKINAFDSSGRTEKNNIIKSEETNTPGSIEFNGISKIDTPAGNSGYYTLIANWEEATGDFSAYKIYAIPKYKSLAEKEANSINPDYNTYISGTTIDPNDTSDYFIGMTNDINETSFTIPGLMKNMEYIVSVLACEAEGSTCNPKTVPKGGDKWREGVTSPKLATFFGINSKIEPLDGAAGLSQGVISWSPPLNDGVCEGIKIINSNSGADVPLCPSPAGGPCIGKIPTCDETSVVVSNLTLGIQFKAKGVIFSEGKQQDPTFLSEGTITPAYNKPNFNPNISCTTNGPTGIDITWDEADNGLFSNYLVIWKETGSSDPFLSNFSGWFNAFETSFKSPSSDPTQTGYQYKVLPKSETNLSVINLSPGKSYRVMVKAYLSLSNDHLFDDNLSINDNCNTEDILVKSGGLERVVALGPLSSDHTFSEKLKIKDGRVNVIKGEGSSYGNVLLQWNNFKLSDGRSISEIIDSIGSSLVPDDGYHVFRRVATAPSISGNDVTNYLNNISEGSGWENLTKNDGGLRANLATGKVVFVDELDSSIHPHTNQAKLIWYAIKFKLNGRFIKFTEDATKDVIIDVILPPTGMALQHRSIHNKKMCQLLGSKASFQTGESNHYMDQNYRCLYDGLGSINIGGSSYYDTKGHTLIDRKNLNCRDGAPKTNDLGRTLYFGDQSIFGGSLDDQYLNECYVFNDKDATYPTSFGNIDSWRIMEGSTSDLNSRNFSHLGSNYEYKPTYGFDLRSPTSNSDDSYFHYYDPTGVTTKTNVVCGVNNSGTIPPDSCLRNADPNISNIVVNMSPYYNSVRDDYTWRYSYDYQGEWVTQTKIGTQDFYTFNWDVENYFSGVKLITDKDTYYSFHGQRYGYDTVYPTFFRYSNLTRKAFLNLPTGKGYIDGFAQNTALSLYPAPSSDEFLGRTYEDNNTLELHGIGKNITTIEKIKDIENPKVIHNGYSYPGFYGSTVTVPASTDRTCDVGNITYSEEDVNNSTETCTISNFFGPDPVFSCIKCDRYLDDRPIENITASTAHYLCQSHDFMVSTPYHKNVADPTTPSKLVRKRLLSARELMSSLTPRSSDLDVYLEREHDEFGINIVKKPIYLSGQAICSADGTSQGSCYTHPSPSLISSFLNTSDYADGAAWPFFKYNGVSKDTSYPDSDIYKNSQGNSFFWNLTDPNNFLNGGSDPSTNQFGLPHYASTHPNGGSIASNYPLNKFNVSPIIGQPLWCDYDDGGTCESGDELTVSQLNNFFTPEKARYIQIPVRRAQDTSYETSKVFPMVNYYNPDPFNLQGHIMHEYEGKTPTIYDTAKFFGVKWDYLDQVPEGHIGARCAVKLEFDSSGRLINIDGMGVN